MHIPASTYRVQLHQGFTLTDLEHIIDYLHDLGVTTVYAAPILEATPGSLHGYDVTDPHCINPEVGTPEQLKKIASMLNKKGMSWVQDIVPNHMAFHPMNFRLMDVLERGNHSPYYNYFDINWQHHSPELKGKLQVPFLGKPLEQCIDDNEIKIGFSDKGFTVDYFETSYPMSVRAYSILFPQGATAIDHLDGLVSKGMTGLACEEWKKVKAGFVKAVRSNEKTHLAVLEHLETFNADKSNLRRLLEAQYYRLAYWKDSEKTMGYRRFFTVNELICLRMEDKAVFSEYHKLIYSLYKENIIQGVRIDHIDGLNDPSGYVTALRKLFGDECYIIAEKILEEKEAMPPHWPLQGTSGYEFLSFVSQLITNRKGASHLLTFYKTLVPHLPAYKELVLANKKFILDRYMAGELDNLVHYFTELGLQGPMQQNNIGKAIATLMIAFPVYRIYPDRLPLNGENLHVMNTAFEKAMVYGKEYKRELEYLHTLLTKGHSDVALNARALLFARRLMQFTGPLTAKGVEDTTFYVYNALISHDEVGDAPSTLGISISTFHTKMIARQKMTPLSLNATATHDTKRGEDARIRLNVLCEFPEEWQRLVSHWMKVNNKFHKHTSKGKLAPVVNDEYYIYQAITGGFPEDLKITEEWITRLQAYVTKVVREAKANSDWANPDNEYEEACSSFIKSILAHESEFLTTFLPFMNKILPVAYKYSLAQTLIKIAAPGIPDTYQGCELWDLSFVDPDNRRPVDYNKRKNLLSQLQEKTQAGADALFLWLEDRRSEGIEKLFVVWKALNFRKANATLFIEGDYIPLQVMGNDVVTVAFARNLRDRWVLIAIPLVGKHHNSNPVKFSADESVLLPENAPRVWYNVFTGETVEGDKKLSLSACLARFPVALLTNPAR